MVLQILSAFHGKDISVGGQDCKAGDAADFKGLGQFVSLFTPIWNRKPRHTVFFHIFRLFGMVFITADQDDLELFGMGIMEGN